MSSDLGVIIKDGEVAGYFKYYGTSDLIIPTIYQTFEDLRAHWEDAQDEWPLCFCGVSSKVTLYTEYAGGFHWQGEACLECRSIVSQLKMDDPACEIQTTKGFPEGVKVCVGLANYRHSGLSELLVTSETRINLLRELEEQGIISERPAQHNGHRGVAYLRFVVLEPNKLSASLQEEYDQIGELRW